MRALVPIAFVLLAGCGQAGDLYLPPPQAPAPEQPQDQQEKDRK